MATAAPCTAQRSVTHILQLAPHSIKAWETRACWHAWQVQALQLLEGMTPLRACAPCSGSAMGASGSTAQPSTCGTCCRCWCRSRGRCRRTCRRPAACACGHYQCRAWHAGFSAGALGHCSKRLLTQSGRCHVAATLLPCCLDEGRVRGCDQGSHPEGAAAPALASAGLQEASSSSSTARAQIVLATALRILTSLRERGQRVCDRTALASDRADAGLAKAHLGQEEEKRAFKLRFSSQTRSDWRGREGGIDGGSCPHKPMGGAGEP